MGGSIDTDRVIGQKVAEGRVFKSNGYPSQPMKSPAQRVSHEFSIVRMRREWTVMHMTGRGSSRMGRIQAMALATASLVGASWLATGCDSPKKSEAPPVVVTPAPPPAAPEPALRTAGDGHLTIFGELPDQSRVPFHARAASPMKQHSFATEGADFDVDASPDGEWVVFGSTRHSAQPDIYLKRMEGRAVTKLTDDPAGDVQPSFSPDGREIAFASRRSGNWDLWIVGLEGGQARQITRSPQQEVHPSFSPDGKRLVYCMFNEVSHQWELWTLQLDQPGGKRTIGVGLFPEWSPVTDSIVYQKARERGGRWFSIWRVDLELGEPRFPIELAASSEMALIQPSWGPDGEWVTYGSARLGTGGVEDPQAAGAMLTRGDIWIMEADGSSPLQLTDGAGAHFGSVWGIDGRVYFTSKSTGTENVWSVIPLMGEMAQVPAPTEDTAAKPAAAEASRPPTLPNQGG